MTTDRRYVEELAEPVESRSSAEYLAATYPEVTHTYFAQFRESLDSAGPLQVRERELVMLTAYAVANQPRAFGVHLERGLAAGLEVDEIRHALLLTLGASATLERVVDSLRWIDARIAGDKHG